MTMVICRNKECVHAKKREDELYQCSCTTIVIDLDNECDTYFVLPKTKNMCKKCGKPMGNPTFCIFCEEKAED